MFFDDVIVVCLERGVEREVCIVEWNGVLIFEVVVMLGSIMFCVVIDFEGWVCVVFLEDFEMIWVFSVGDLVGVILKVFVDV